MHEIFQFIIANWVDLLWGGLIVTSAIIVILGGLKTLLFNKIPNKLVRKILLALSSLVMVFPAVAIEFWVKGIVFDRYWITCAIYGVMTILTYWVYENTGCRDFIAFIGNQTVVRFIRALAAAITHRDEEKLKEDVGNIEEEIKTEVLEQYSDRDLNNL